MQHKIVTLISSLLPGALFLFSGLTKLWDIDYFQDYVFGLGVISLNTSILLARLLIALELVLGCLLVLRFFPRTTSILSLCILTFFNLFLVFQLWTGNGADCHCFGHTVLLSSGWSLLKNHVLQIIIVGYWYLAPAPVTKKNIGKWSVAILGTALLLSFSLRMPLVRWKSSATVQNYCTPCVARFIQTQQLQNHKAVLCFFSTECKYCKLAAGRMSTIATRTAHPDRIQYVLWDEKDNVQTFFSESKSASFATSTLSEDAFLDLTLGQMPLILLVDHSKIVHAYRYSDMDESVIRTFLE